MIDKLAWIPIRNRRVLFVRSHNQELFFNAGGKRKINESDHEALIREIAEELGVRLISKTLVYECTFSGEVPGRSGIFVQIKCFSGEYVGNLKPCSEIEEIAWFSSEDSFRTTPTGQQILTWLHEQDIID